MNFIRKHVASYRYAFRGIGFAFGHERNMLIHFIAAVTVIVLNVSLGVSKIEWLITLILIGLAWTAELFNTALEKLADHISAQYHPLIGQAKDLSAGAVLVICIVAALCGLIIYWPYVTL